MICCWCCAGVVVDNLGQRWTPRHRARPSSGERVRCGSCAGCGRGANLPACMPVDRFPLRVRCSYGMLGCGDRTGSGEAYTVPRAGKRIKVPSGDSGGRPFAREKRSRALGSGACYPIIYYPNQRLTHSSFSKNNIYFPGGFTHTTQSVYTIASLVTGQDT